MIYRISHDIDYIRDQERDAQLIEFPDSSDVAFSNSTLDRSALIPQPIEFVGDLGVLARTDYPYIVPSGYPMVSLRLLNALLEAGELRYTRTTPEPTMKRWKVTSGTRRMFSGPTLRSRILGSTRTGS